MIWAQELSLSNSLLDLLSLAQSSQTVGPFRAPVVNFIEFFGLNYAPIDVTPVKI